MDRKMETLAADDAYMILIFLPLMHLDDYAYAYHIIIFFGFKAFFKSL